MLGDVSTARAVVATEGQDIEVGWPPSVRLLAGQHNVFLVKDQAQHAALRRLLNPAFRQVSALVCRHVCDQEEMQ